MTVLPGARLWGQEGGMLGRQTGGTVGRYRQVCVLMVVAGMEGFTWTKKMCINYFKITNAGSSFHTVYFILLEWE